MKLRRTKTALVGLAALATILAAARTVIPRVKQRRRLERAIAALRAGADDRGAAAWELIMGFDEPEATLALIEHDRDAAPTADGDLAHLAVMIFAASEEPSDPRVRALLERIASDATLSTAKRLHARVYLDELDAPTYPREPGDFPSTIVAIRCARDGDVFEATRALRAACPLPIDLGDAKLREPIDVEDRAYRALVELAQALGATIAIEPERIRLVPRPTQSELRYAGFEPARIIIKDATGADWTLTASSHALLEGLARDPELAPARAFRALASLQLCELRSTGPRAFELVERKP